MPKAFNRRAYSTIDDAFRRTVGDESNRIVPQPFAGGDLAAYINNIKVANLEAITFSTSVEVVGNYALGSRDALSYTRGKRVIVGSMSLTQWDRHVLLHQVFNLLSRDKAGITAQELFTIDQDSAFVQSALDTISPKSSSTSGVREALLADQIAGEPVGIMKTSLARGLSRSDYNFFLRQAIQDTVHLMGSRFIKYSDQIPPFDLTLVGTNPNGATAYCAVHGITITQETGGFSMNDLGNTVGMSFVALHIEPWRPLWEDQHLAISQLANTKVS